MKQSPRWQSSAACADATSPQSKQFCAIYRATELRLKSQSTESDPQSALFAKLTGLEIHRVQMVLSLFLAIACEVISALGFFAILTRNGPALGSPAALYLPCGSTESAVAVSAQSRDDRFCNSIPSVKRQLIICAQGPPWV